MCIDMPDLTGSGTMITSNRLHLEARGYKVGAVANTASARLSEIRQYLGEYSRTRAKALGFFHDRRQMLCIAS